MRHLASLLSILVAVLTARVTGMSLSDSIAVGCLAADVLILMHLEKHAAPVDR